MQNGYIRMCDFHSFELDISENLLSYEIPHGTWKIVHMQIFKVLRWRPVKLLLIPGLAEAFFDGGLMIKIFKMPATFAFATGFILKAVGPALVIQAMFEVQQRRLGVRKGD